ncbi:MAG: barnase inhibitor [Gammaproteobacteria bacterium]|nr:barnase inhibitor [Gammaproteobacteria bacterium]
MAAPFKLSDIGAAASIHFEVAFDPSAQQGADVEVAEFMVCHIDCREFAPQKDCFETIGAAIGFPHEDFAYGHNPNAFLDWLTDLTWIKNLRGILVVLHSSQALWARWPYDAGILVEVWLRAADSWGKDDIPCHLVFDLAPDWARWRLLDRTQERGCLLAYGVRTRRLSLVLKIKQTHQI